MAVLAALSLGVGALGLSTPSASAADDSSSFTIEPTTQSPQVLAASGSGIVIGIENDEDYTYRVSRDSGANWTDFDASFDDTDSLWAADGHAVWSSDEGDSFAVHDYDLTTGESTVLGQVDDRPEVANRKVALLDEYDDEDDDDGITMSYRAVNLDSGDTTILADSGHELPGDPESRAFLATSDYAVAAVLFDVPATGYLDLLPLSGGKATSVKINDLAAVGMSGDKLAYLTVTKSATSICFRSVSTWKSASCRTVVKKDLRDAGEFRLDVGPDWTVVSVERWSGGRDQYVVAGTSLPTSITKVALPTGVAALELVGAGDSVRPLALVATDDSGYLARYEASGNLTRLTPYDSATNSIEDLALTPDVLYGSDSRPTRDNPGFQTWSRSVSGTTVSATETPFAQRASGGLVASGARAAMATTSGVKLYDGGTPTRSLPYSDEVLAMSGTYYLDQARNGTTSVRGIDGKQLLKGSVVGVFGSLALKQGKAGRYQVVDLAKVLKNVSFTVPSGDYGYENAQLWGDWMIAEQTTDSDNGTDAAFAYNYRTNTTKTMPGDLAAVGDGFALVFGANDQLVRWDFATGAARTLVDDGGDIDRVATDGSHLFAYSVGSTVVVGSLGSGVELSAPRLLGVVAASTFNNRPSSARWSLDVDATKALKEGTLTIKDAKLNTVRTIDVPATANGSIRGLTWDGRDATDKAVSAGTYSWELVVPAADGTGNLVRVDGSSGITGKLTVKPAFLGTVSGSTPKIVGKATFGQKLSVNVGTWKPSAATLVYQWYRDGKAIDGGAASGDYTVGVADVGHKLKVSVTGTADGWKTTVKTSSSTSKVAAAGLGTGTVTIDTTAPKVGDTVTAQEGTWTPDTTTFTYQWYRVVKGKAQAIPGDVGKAKTYTVTATDTGASLTVTVTGSCPGYANKAVSSAQTAAVVA